MKPKFDVPLTAEELDEFERACEGFFDDDPNDKFAEVALRLFQENRDLRHLLRLLRQGEAQQVVIAQAGKIEKQKERIGELELLRDEQDRKSLELAGKIDDLEAERDRLQVLLTSITTAIGTALSTMTPPPLPDVPPELALQRFTDDLVSETGAVGGVRVVRDRVDVEAARVVPSSKKRRDEGHSGE